MLALAFLMTFVSGACAAGALFQWSGELPYRNAIAWAIICALTAYACYMMR